MPTAEKFLFEVDFDQPAVPTPPSEPEDELPPPPTYSEEQLAAARAEARSHGQVKGRADALETIEQSCAEALKSIAAELDSLHQGLDTRQLQMEREALATAVEMVRKLFPTLAEHSDLSEIEAVLSDSFDRLRSEPRIVVRLSDATLDRLRERIDALSAGSGFEGKVVLLSESSFRPSEVRVEWADGGAERDLDHLWSEIEHRIGQLFSDEPPGTPDKSDRSTRELDREGLPR